MKSFFLITTTIFLFAFFGFVRLTDSTAQRKSAEPDVIYSKRQVFAGLIASAERSGSARVIVGLKTKFLPEGDLLKNEIDDQRREIKHAQDSFLTSISSLRNDAVIKYDYIPYVAFEADAQMLRKMETDVNVISIEPDQIGEAALAESIPIVGADVAWASGFSGAGQTVAIVDSGVDKNHTFLAGRVVSEACYSSNVSGQSVSVCPGGVTDSTAPDSGLHCPTSVEGCAHGTNVAGIAAGRGTSFSGVAKDANIIAVQIFSRFDSSTTCGATTPCARYWTSDLIRGLERVRALKSTIPNIAAVNLSLQTGQQFTFNCDAPHAATKAAIDNLRSVGVATVICSGNYAFTSALTAPACISSSISVGSIDDGSLGTSANVVSSFSDSSPLLHLLAPGRWINSSIPNNLFQNYSGTSMAAPHVTGAYAVLRQKAPNASVGKIASSLMVTGQPITDSRNGLVKPRINIGAALAIVNKAAPYDFDGDAKTDIGIFRPSINEWWIYQSSTGTTFSNQPGGPGTDVMTPGDFTGDGRTDIAFYRPESGYWFIFRSEDFSFYGFGFGYSGDTPMPADYDGDGKTDAAVYRPSTSAWYILRSSDGGVTSLNFGVSGDKPVAADYDGDGKADIAIYRPNGGTGGEWWILKSSNGSIFAATFGTSSDKPVQGDYTGDGKADCAFFRPSNGFWYILRSEDQSYYGFPFGVASDTLAPGDYDGDGKFDAAVFRQPGGQWYVNKSSGGVLSLNFGAPGDQPIPNAFVR